MLIHRYITRDFLKTAFFLMLFLLLVVISNRLLWVLSRTASGKFASETLFQILGLQIPEMLLILLPVSLVIGVIVTFNRLSAHHEVDVLYSSGMSQAQLFKIAFVLALAIAVFNSFNAMWLAPKAVKAQQALILENKESLAKSLMTPGQFLSLPKHRGVVYVESVNRQGQDLQRIFAALEDTDDANHIDILLAQQGRQLTEQTTAGVHLTLDDGRRYEGTLGQNDLTMTAFESLTMNVGQEPEALRLKRRAKATVDLMSSDDPKDTAELYWRLSMPILVPIMVLFAMPVCRTAQRRERTGRILSAILMTLIYIAGIMVVQSWVENQWLSLLSALILVHSIFLAIGLLLQLDAMRWTIIKRRVCASIKRSSAA